MNSSRTQTGRSYTDVMRGLRPLFVSALLFSALVNILMLTGSVYMLQVYDRVLSSGSVPTLVGLFLIVVLLYCFLGLYDFLRLRILSRAGLRLDRDMGARAFAKSLTDRQTLDDLETVRANLSGPAIVTLFDLPFVPLFLGLLFILHPWLGWLTLAGAGIACVIASGTRALNRRAITQAQGSQTRTRAVENGSRRASETVLALGLARPLAQEWRRHRDAQMAALQEGRDPADMLSSMSRAFRMLLQSTILSLGAYLVIRGELSAGMIIASSILSGRALAPIDQLAAQAPVLARGRQAHQRLTLALPAEAPGPAIELPRPKGHVKVDSLVRLVPVAPGMIPRPNHPRLLSDISFALEPGDVLGVIGASGSGKSTLARLLVGALDPDGGSIRIDGATLDQWTQGQRCAFLGYLPQQVEMLPGTVRDNIAHFDPAAPDEAIIAAARLAGVHDIILNLPDGYGSRICDISLSGGQMQRIALARAVYANPAVLVLDEPNSNLDAVGERALVHAIETLSEMGTTVVLIAHRTEALRCLTKLLIMKDGAVDAFGPVRDVLAMRPDMADPTSPGKGATTPAETTVTPMMDYTRKTAPAAGRRPAARVSALKGKKTV